MAALTSVNRTAPRRPNASAAAAFSLAVKVQALYGMARMPREARAAMPEITKIARNRDKKSRRLSRAARDVMKQLRSAN